MPPKKKPIIIAVTFAIGFSALLFALHLANPGSHAATSCAPTSATPASSCRPLFGGAIWGYSGAPASALKQFAYLENLVGAGVHFDVYRSYHNPPSSDSATSFPTAPLSSTEQQLVKQGTYLDIDWKPVNQWKDAGGGNANINNEIKQGADSIKSIAPTPVFLTVWHEPQNDVTKTTSDCCRPEGGPTPCPGGAGTPQQYVAMWQNVEKIFQQQGVHNVIWTMDYMSQPADEFGCLASRLWPGNSLVDWVLYDVYGTNNNPTWADSTGRMYSEVAALQGQKNLAGQAISVDNKPWGLGEFGTCGSTVTASNANHHPTPAEQYYTQALSAYKANTYPRLHMYLVFADTGNSNGGQGVSCLTNEEAEGTAKTGFTPIQDQQKEAGFGGLAKGLLGTSSGGGHPTPSVSLTAPANHTTVSGKAVTVAAKASISSGGITKLVLSIHGATLRTCSNSPCSTTWNTTALANGSYTVVATATASGGGTNTTTETVTVFNSPTTISPSNVTSPAQTTTSISLSWSPAKDSQYAASQLTYHISRDGKTVGTTKPGTTNYTDTKLAPGTYYSYRISASDPAGHASVPSSALTQNTKKPDCSPPPAPNGLGSATLTPTSVTIRWQAVPNPSKACTVAHYVVERGGVALAQPTTLSYTDNTVTPHTTYRYSVLAILNGNIAGAARTVTLTTPVSHTPDPGPSAPTHLAATPLSPTQVNLTWSASSDRITGVKQYTVLRNGKQVGTTATTSFGDAGLQPHTGYTYQVVAVSGGNKTASSAVVHATTLSSSTIGGGTGTGSGDSASSIPILQGTTSVGSGSDIGQSTSQNPTAPGAGTTITALGPPTQPPSSRGMKLHTVAYIGGLVGILLLAGGLALRLFWRRRASQVTPYDPDLYAATVVRPNDKHNDQDKEHQP